MEDINFGEKMSFYQLISGKDAKNVLIPSIQRDYTYGALTEDTDKVLNSLLTKIKKTLFPHSLCQDSESELTLNFVYGFTQEDINYVPLDGQQRLTTLFLLYYYAALFDSSSDFDILSRFTYATRETTKNYCRAIISYHTDIVNNLDSKGLKLKDSIEDMSWFIPSFYTDPSIRSMQVVLERIEETFNDVRKDLWDKLTRPDCLVNFYLLNFGPFHLSDDLYVKMNSRGKKLTEYEIFKSNLLKHVEKTLCNPSFKCELAIKFDNEWTDLVWESIGRPEQENSLECIDEAYILLMKIVQRYLSYRHNQPILENNNKLSPENIKIFYDKLESVKFLYDFMDVFYIAHKKYEDIDKAIEYVTLGISQIDDKRKYSYKGCLNKKPVSNGDCLCLYGIYMALSILNKSPEQIDSIQINIRHLRNIIENSDNEIRDSKMPSLLEDVEKIMKGDFDSNYQTSFNKNQWKEECEKHKYLKEWKRLWQYEEHYLLRGALSGFADNQELDLNDTCAIDRVIKRLDKFEYIFDSLYRENDKLIRSALLTIDDYSQYLDNDEEYRILGNIPLCWRLMFVKNEKRKRQNVIMGILDRLSINKQCPVKSFLEKCIKDYLADISTDKKDWKYYVIKYRDYTYKAYSHNERYGYFYVNNQAKSLEVAILQSSGFGSSNVAWYLLPLILKERNENKYNLYLGTHAAREEEKTIEIINKKYPIQLGISDQYGWYITGLPKDEAIRLGLTFKVCENNQQTMILCCGPNSNEDYIEWAENNILERFKGLSGFER